MTVPTTGQVLQNPTAGKTNAAQGSIDFQESWLGRLHRRRVVENDNDLLVAVSASSKSAVSGVGKTTLGIKLCRNFDVTEGGWNGEKATLDSGEFTEELLKNEEDVPNKSAVLFDEIQGTLSSDGADSRRGMAQSVMDISKGMATLRYRQVSTVIITQSPDWIDKRIRNLLDALILVQEPGRAEVFDIYKNDLSTGSKEYTEHKQTIYWDPLPDGDLDYQKLHELKAESADDDEEEADNNSLTRREEVLLAANKKRQTGVPWSDVPDTDDRLTYSGEFYRKESEDLF